jgi:hypothetical protein
MASDSAFTVERLVAASGRGDAGRPVEHPSGRSGADRWAKLDRDGGRSESPL